MFQNRKKAICLASWTLLMSSRPVAAPSWLVKVPLHHVTDLSEHGSREMTCFSRTLYLKWAVKGLLIMPDVELSVHLNDIPDH